MELAKYKSAQHGFELVFEAGNDPDGHSGYTRISEVVEVEFPPRQQHEIIQEEVAELDKTLDEMMLKIQSIRARKAELLSLEALT